MKKLRVYVVAGEVPVRVQIVQMYQLDMMNTVFVNDEIQLAGLLHIIILVHEPTARRLRDWEFIKQRLTDIGTRGAAVAYVQL